MNFDDFERNEADAYLWRVGLLNVKQKGMIILYIINWCLVMFLRGGKVITLQMGQQLKTKNINVVPGQLACRQCNAKFLLETDKGKFQSVADADNEFSECQTPRKKL